MTDKQKIGANNTFPQPDWDKYMAGGDMPASELSGMLRYLFAKTEMLEQRIIQLEAKEALR
jgi:hypothetical protein